MAAVVKRGEAFVITRIYGDMQQPIALSVDRKGRKKTQSKSP